MPAHDSPRTGSSGAATICIVSGELNRLFRNGGIGTACTGLAQLLADQGHRVTVLYTGDLPAKDAGTFQTHADFYARELGVEIVALPRSRLLGPNAARFAAQSLSVYHHLRDGDWDAVFFNDVCAEGYYTVVAKRVGLGFANTALCVVTHGPRTWVRDLNQWPLNNGDELENVFMERETARFADHVISPSQYMLDWLADDGWELPESARVTKVRLPRWRRPPDAPPMPPREAVRELVFFGRLETRKGVALFCDAVDELADDASAEASAPSGLRITFMGKFGDVLGEHGGSYVLRRARRWPFELRFLPRLDQHEAIAYLRQSPAALAVIPSLVDNLPCVVHECLQQGLSFVATATGGIPELIFEADRARCLTAPDPAALAHAIRPFFDAAPPAWRPAESPAAIDAAWLATLDDVLATRTARPAARPAPTPTAAGLPVVAVGPGANPRAAIEAAAGDHLLLVAAGTKPSDDAARRLLDVAAVTGADVVTCFGHDRGENTVSSLGLGDAREAGYCRNVFGGGLALVRKAAFVDSGLLDAADFGDNLWASYCEASFAGLRLVCVPEPLCSFVQGGDAGASVDTHAAVRRVFERYDYRDCSLLFDLLVGYVAPADRQPYHTMLGETEHGEVLLQLCRVPPQSDRALALMASHATRTQRFQTAFQLHALVNAGQSRPRSVLPVQPTLAKNLGSKHLAWSVMLTREDMRAATLSEACADIQADRAFMLVRMDEQTPAVQVHPVIGGEVSGVVALGSAEGLREVHAQAFLGNPESPPVEFRLAVARTRPQAGHDPLVAACEWTRVDDPGLRVGLHLRLPALGRGDYELVLSTRLPGDRMAYAHARFADIRLVFDGARLTDPDDGSGPGDA